MQQSISDTVVKGLSSPTIITAQPIEQKTVEEKKDTPLVPDFIVNPDNEKIITTKEELEILRIVTALLPDHELTGRDTESYYSVICQGKNNRWLFRYDVNRKRHTIQFIVPMDESRRNELERAGLEVHSNGQIFLDHPDYIYRMVGILRDSLDYCMNDDNFKRASS